jgi:hypothetical protein
MKEQGDQGYFEWIRRGHTKDEEAGTQLPADDFI